MGWAEPARAVSAQAGRKAMRPPATERARWQGRMCGDCGALIFSGPFGGIDLELRDAHLAAFLVRAVGLERTEADEAGGDRGEGFLPPAAVVLFDLRQGRPGLAVA